MRIKNVLLETFTSLIAVFFAIGIWTGILRVMDHIEFFRNPNLRQFYFFWGFEWALLSILLYKFIMHYIFKIQYQGESKRSFFKKIRYFILKSLLAFSAVAISKLIWLALIFFCLKFISKDLALKISQFSILGWLFFGMLSIWIYRLTFKIKSHAGWASPIV